MSNFQYIFYSFVALMIIGTIIPLVISPFVDDEGYDEESIIAPLIDFINVEFEIHIPLFTTLRVVPIEIFPEFITENIRSYIYSLSYIPNIILTPFMILFALSMIIFLAKIMPFT